MAKTGFCSECWKPTIETLACVCGKQNLCDNCAHAAVCDKCKQNCCKQCHFKLLCCGLVFCHDDAQLCLTEHGTVAVRPCGHLGCSFHQECLECHPKIANKSQESSTKEGAPPASKPHQGGNFWNQNDTFSNLNDHKSKRPNH
jgi:hypothetical protein